MKINMIDVLDELEGLPQFVKDEGAEYTVLLNVVSGFKVYIARKEKGLIKKDVTFEGLNVVYERLTHDEYAPPHGASISGEQVTKFLSLMKAQAKMLS